MADQIDFDAIVLDADIREPLYTERSVRGIEIYDELGAPRWDGTSDFSAYVKAFAKWERDHRTELRRSGIRGR